MRKIYLIVFFIFIQFLTCTDKSPIESENHYSFIRLVNFNYNSLPVDLFIDNEKIINSIYPNNSSGYIKTIIDNCTLKLSYSDSITSLYTNNAELKHKQYYTIFTAFRSDSMRIFWFDENLNINKDSTQMRLFHYSQIGDTLDFKIVNSSDSVIFSNLKYGDFTSPEFITSEPCYHYIRPFEFNFFAKYDTLLNLENGNSYTYIIRDGYYSSEWYPYDLFRLQDNGEGLNIIHVN